MSRYSQPNLIRVGPNGSVEAVFPGGVILPVTPAAPSVAAEQRIDWQRTTDGARVATLYAAENYLGGRTAFFDTSPSGGGEASQTILGAGTADQSFPTSPRLRVFNVSGGARGVDVSADGNNGRTYALLKDKVGRSDFVGTSYGLAVPFQSAILIIPPFNFACAAGGGFLSAVFVLSAPLAGLINNVIFGAPRGLASNAFLCSWGWEVTNVGGNFAVQIGLWNPTGFATSGTFYGAAYFQWNA